MAGVAFSIVIEDLPDVEAALLAIDEAMTDLTPFMEDVGRELVSTTQRRFEAETGPDGQKWKPSARAKNDGGLTLTDSGRLRDSVVFEASADRVEVGSNAVQARIHQLGGEIRPVSASSLRFHIPGMEGWVHTRLVVMPARPYLGLDEADETNIVELLRVRLDAATRGAGAGA